MITCSMLYPDHSFIDTAGTFALPVVLLPPNPKKIVSERPNEVDEDDRRPQALAAAHLCYRAAAKVEKRRTDAYDLGGADNKDELALLSCHFGPGPRLAVREVDHAFISWVSTGVWSDLVRVDTPSRIHLNLPSAGTAT
jgi:hypothetical protein